MKRQASNHFLIRQAGPKVALKDNGWTFAGKAGPGTVWVEFNTDRNPKGRFDASAARGDFPKVVKGLAEVLTERWDEEGWAEYHSFQLGRMRQSFEDGKTIHSLKVTFTRIDRGSIREVARELGWILKEYGFPLEGSSL